MREQKRVRFADVWGMFRLGAGCSYMFAGISLEIADNVLKMINERIAKIEQERVDAKELETAKQILRIGYDLYEAQTAEAQVRSAVYYEALGLGYNYPSRIKMKTDAVTREDVLRVAREYLGQSVTFVLRPPQEKEELQGANESRERERGRCKT